MDNLPEYFFSLVQHPSLQALTATPFASHLSTLRSAYIDPYVVRPLSTILTSSMPDLVSVLVLALILLISLKILDYARRLVMFWVALVFRLVFWGSVLGAAYYVYSVGWEKACTDLGWLWGVVEGFVQDFQTRGVGGLYEKNRAGQGMRYGRQKW